MSAEEVRIPEIAKRFRHYLDCRAIKWKIGGTIKQEILDFWPENDGKTMTYVFRFENGNIGEGEASIKYFGLEKFVERPRLKCESV